MDNLAALGPPPDEAIYKDPETAKIALQDHARRNGYSIAVASSKGPRVIYKCSKSGKYQDRKDSNMHETKRRKNTSTMKTDCPFRVDASKLDYDAGWQVEVAKNTHNHKAVAALSALPMHRIAAITLLQKAKVKEMQGLCYSPNQILHALQKDDLECALIPRDIYNLLASLRIEELNGQSPIEWLLQVTSLLLYSISNSLSNN
jgi:hypothetical protein